MAAKRVSYAERAEQIAAHLLSAGSQTEAQIAAACGLQQLCAYRALRRMIDEGRVRIAGRSERDDVRGPKPMLYGLPEDWQSGYASEREHA